MLIYYITVVCLLCVNGMSFMSKRGIKKYKPFVLFLFITILQGFEFFCVAWGFCSVLNLQT